MTKDVWTKNLQDMPPAAKSYWTRARQYLEKTGTEWEVVDVDSPEYHEWVRYFRWLGFKPAMITFAEKKMVESIMVPSRMPEWFDPAYAGAAEPAPFPVPPPPVRKAELVKPGEVNWRQYLQAVADGKAKRPVFSEREDIARREKRKVYSENEKDEFLENAMRVGESIKGMKLSAAARATLRDNP